MENVKTEAEEQKAKERAINALRVKEDYYKKREQNLIRAKKNYLANREVFHCECGGTVTYANRGQYNSALNAHLKTKKHIYYIRDNIEI
jgi:hypothetical protein